MSVDEPLVWEDESSVVEHAIDVPTAFEYVGAVREAAIPDDHPKIYLDYGVAKRLQEEAQRSIRVNAEVGGILLGTTTTDGSIIKVSHIAIGRDEDSSPVHYKFSYSVWDDLIDQMEEMSKEAGETLLLVGWYHTHPNMAVFLSRYDLRTHRDFHRPYQFALVLAPRVGTEDTKVGFFVNRRGSTPLLPGLRLYGASPGADVATELPWQFQEVEAEGIEEGEDLGGRGDPRDQTPVVHQLGIVRREDPNWLMLGLDKAEGPVLPILEGMAATVVNTGADRIGVLLGTKTSKNHVTINRVRFLGKLGADSGDERAEILGTLRFMAETFPAHGEQKILGLVRIVSPHRFSAGDIYDPMENNIQVAQLLGEVGYDLNEVPFQVGVVLYPGIEDDCLFFQVFAQHKTSRPVPLMSMRAMAPDYMKPGERYEPVDGHQFLVEEAPSMSAPISGVYAAAEEPSAPPQLEPEDTATAADFAAVDVVDPDLEIGGTQRSSRGLVVAALVVLVAALGAIAVLLPGGEEEMKTTEEVAQDLDAVLESVGDPYRYTLSGCGVRWNPGIPCEPFAGAEAGESAALVTVDLFPAYAAATFNPLDAWLMREDARVKLARAKEGKQLVFSVERARADELLGSEEAVPVTLVLAPRGTELTIDDEFSALRRTESFDLRVAPSEDGAGEAGSEGGHAGLQVRPAASAGNWAFADGSYDATVRWDGKKEAFASPIVVRGGGAGSWSLRVATKPGGTPLAEKSARAKGSRQDLSRPLAELLGRPAVAATVAELVLRSGSAVFVDLVPPEGPALNLRVPVGAMMVEHKVCVMMAGPDGSAAAGQAQVNGGGMRPTFSPSKDGAPECSDGGKTGRWSSVTFGPGKAKVEFVYQGNDEALAGAKGQSQFGLLSRKWNDPANGTKCLGVTITLGETGMQKSVPSAVPLYSLVDGACE